MRKHNWHPKIIENYLEKYYKNIDTRDTCRVYLKSFFSRIKREPKDFVKVPTKQIQEILFEFAKTIEDKPKKTQSAMLSIIKKFLIRNEIEIKEIIWEDIRIRNNIIPLGFNVMNEFIKNGFILKDTIIKEQYNDRSTAFYVNQNLRRINHEYLFIFNKN